MDLSQVLAFVGLNSNDIQNCELTDIQIDSRKIKTGDLFVAVPGSQTDGRDYITQAKANGAAAILDDPEIKNQLPELAAFFYNYPARDLKIIGITGTNGKTSCSHYIAQILSAAGLECGIMGTLGNGLINNLHATSLTTSDSCTIQQQFAEFREQQVEYVAMEVSSHALVQQRLRGVNIDTAVFTNLSQDHLDYHTNMTEYFAAKSLLFTDYNIKHSVLNVDDPYSQDLIKIINNKSKVYTYSINNKADVYLLDNIVYTPWGQGRLDSPLIGKFNLSNILACITCCILQGVSLENILAIVKKIQPVPGRMQTVRRPELPLVIIDYAHTPDALVKALQAAREQPHAKLYCIFGCGGDRDRTKRPLMLQAALTNSDYVVITQDNPRTEDPKQIINDILSDINKTDNITIELDRAMAIRQTILKAQPQDIVLIAGKGHENYQIIGMQKIPFSDLTVSLEVKRV